MIGHFVLSVEGWPRARRSWSASLRVGSLPSSEAEVRGVVEGLGRETSSEAEVAPQVRGGVRMGCTVEPGRGLSAKWATLSHFLFFGSEEDCSPSWARSLNMCLRFEDNLVS